MAAAVIALEACAHHRSKVPEVSAAVTANLSHGILISRLRHLVQHSWVDMKGKTSKPEGGFLVLEIADSERRIPRAFRCDFLLRRIAYQLATSRSNAAQCGPSTYLAGRDFHE